MTTTHGGSRGDRSGMPSWTSGHPPQCPEAYPLSGYPRLHMFEPGSQTWGIHQQHPPQMLPGGPAGLGVGHRSHNAAPPDIGIYIYICRPQRKHGVPSQKKKKKSTRRRLCREEVAESERVYKGDLKGEQPARYPAADQFNVGMAGRPTVTSPVAWQSSQRGVSIARTTASDAVLHEQSSLGSPRTLEWGLSLKEDRCRRQSQSDSRRERPPGRGVPPSNRPHLREVRLESNTSLSPPLAALAKIVLLEERMKAAEAEIKELKKQAQISTAVHRKLNERMRPRQHGDLDDSLRVYQKQLDGLKAQNIGLNAENAAVRGVAAKFKAVLDVLRDQKATSYTSYRQNIITMRSDMTKAAAERTASDKLYQQTATALRAELAELTDQKAASDMLYRQNITMMRVELAELKNHHHRTLSGRLHPRTQLEAPITTRP